jgi:hypothetical protein
VPALRGLANQRAISTQEFGHLGSVAACFAAAEGVSFLENLALIKLKTPDPFILSRPLYSLSPQIMGSNNCYSYALNRPNLPNGQPRPAGKPQPGEASGQTVDFGNYAGDLNEAAKRDNCAVKDLPADGKVPPGYHKIQAFYDPNGGDYHWYRQDADGTWSQKHGNAEVSNTDASGNVITDPTTADNNYNKIYGARSGTNYSKHLPVLIAPN